jgi:hypothetical protein
MNKLLSVEEGLTLHARLLELKQDISLRFLEVGKILYRLKEEGLYRVINPDMGWEAYCAMPEISISPSHARNLMRIYKIFTLGLGVPNEVLAGIDQRKLTAILPSVNEENVEQLIAEAKTLTRSDLQKNLKENPDCVHEWQAISFERCKHCYEERGRTKSDL